MSDRFETRDELPEPGPEPEPEPDYEACCFNEQMSMIAERQVTARLAGDPRLFFFCFDGGHTYADRFRREAERMHESRPREDRTWF